MSTSTDFTTFRCGRLSGRRCDAYDDLLPARPRKTISSSYSSIYHSMQSDVSFFLVDRDLAGRATMPRSPSPGPRRYSPHVALDADRVPDEHDASVQRDFSGRLDSSSSCTGVKGVLPLPPILARTNCCTPARRVKRQQQMGHLVQ